MTTQASALAQSIQDLPIQRALAKHSTSIKSVERIAEVGWVIKCLDYSALLMEVTPDEVYLSEGTWRYMPPLEHGVDSARHLVDTQKGPVQ